MTFHQGKSKVKIPLLSIIIFLAIVSISGLVLWMIFKNRIMMLLGIDNFYPIVSREVAEYREADKKQNLGVLEPDFSSVNRGFAGFSNDSVSLE